MKLVILEGNLMGDIRLKQARISLFKSTFARLTIITVILYFLVSISGAYLKTVAVQSVCDGWPVCVPANPIGWIDLLHRVVVGFMFLLSVCILILAWRTQRSSAFILVSATISFVLILAQALLGKRLIENSLDFMQVLHQATAISVFVSLIVLIVAIVYEARTEDDEKVDFASIKGRKLRLFALDLLMLTKPIVVILLLVTTFAGMVIGAQAWPSLSLVFWTLVGGFMAAGGSGAINQFLDRDDDLKMQRTQKRPIPAGRLTPAEGLAFGSALAVGSFFVLVAYTNLLSALLSLAGIIYYVLLYSLILKKTTVQNIVIGGGAGAIPPLVGWAAATGALNIPSLFLFAVIFMWTPPHFWALALVRRNDYARAGIPMLPVVRGEAETRKQILIYTIELVILTLLLPVFGLGGAVYLIGAVLLGLWLASTAYRVWKHEGNKVAWKMYRYSSMYLAFLFIVLMVDRLL